MIHRGDFMKKATNINEFANNLIPENFLKPEDKDVYVPIYEDLLKVLRDMVIKDEVESQAFFVSGQAGTGKTTALNFFTTKTLEKQYSIKYINMLYTVLMKNVPVSETSIEFIELLQANNVVAYENGEPWYEVNPIISNTVKVYAERQQKE